MDVKDLMGELLILMAELSPSSSSSSFRRSMTSLTQTQTQTVKTWNWEDSTFYLHPSLEPRREMVLLIGGFILKINFSNCDTDIYSLLVFSK